MPQKREPKRLELLALAGVGQWLKIIGRDLMHPVYLATQHDPDHGQLFLQSCVTLVRETLYATVPWYLFDQMTTRVLSAVSDLIDETKQSYDSFRPMCVFLNKMKVAVTLTEVIMHPHLKEIEVCKWPKIMRHVLNQNLHRLVGLEVLNLGSGTSGWDMTETEKYILSGVQLMSNLTTFCLCFDCTNNIISALGANCPQLQNLDVTSSRSVTDRSIPHLLKCKELRQVKLTQTSVTVAGYKDLLSGLPNIQDIGRCDDFGRVLQKLHEQKCSALPLLSVQCRDMNFAQLRLLVIFCPFLTSITIFHDERIADLTVLDALQNLKDLKILNGDFYTDRVKNLLETVGITLNSLLLEHVDEIDLNALVSISQLCPNLNSLSFINCEFSSHTTLSYDKKKLPVVPFTRLERLVCVSDCSLNHLEFLLMHCKNIKFIQLGSSTGINDATITRVLDKNPMVMLEELRILYGEDLSMTSVHRLMECERLRKLSELQGWGGVDCDEILEFKGYLRENNIDLDIRPTLSYASSSQRLPL